MACLDNCACQPRYADSVRTALWQDQLAVRPLYVHPHGYRIFRAKIEDVADFYTASGKLPLRRHFRLEACRVVLVAGCCVFGGPPFKDRAQILTIVDIRTRHWHFYEIAVAKYLTFAGVGEDDELVGEIASDGTA